MATLTTIAKALSIAPSTVSRALTRNGPAAPHTRLRVIEEADRQGYCRQRRLPGSLRAEQEDRKIGLILPDCRSPLGSIMTDLVTALLLEREYSVVTAHTRNSASTESAILKQWSNLDLCGVIAAPARDNMALYRSMNATLPVVFIEHSPGTVGCDSVESCHETGVTLALDRLYNSGHRHVAWINAKSRSAGADAVTRAVMARAHARRDFSVELLSVDAPTDDAAYMRAFEKGVMLLKRPKRERITAVVGGSEMICAGFLYALSLSGLAMPEDISVISYYDAPWCSFFQIPVSAVKQPFEEMAHEAVRLLCEKLERRRSDSISVLLEPSLNDRSSVKRF